MELQKQIKEITATGMKKAFAQHRLNGFALNFPNGNWISTIWGDGSYSDNHDLVDSIHGFEFMEILIAMKDVRLGSNNVEVMIMCSEKLKTKIHKRYGGDGNVIGYLTQKQWLEIVNMLATEGTGFWSKLFKPLLNRVSNN